MRFSERLGYRIEQPDLPEKAISDSLKAGLWDVCRMIFFENIRRDEFVRSSSPNEEFEHISFLIWFHLYNEPTDTRPDAARNILQEIRERFFNYGFPEFYDFLEFMANIKIKDDPDFNRKSGEGFSNLCNSILEREKAVFRFAGTQLVKVTGEEEVLEIKNAQSQNRSSTVSEHIRTATILYSDRNNPDYRNSIKESISAVEAACNYVTEGKSTNLSIVLNNIEKSHGLHPAFKDGLKKIYGYTSDASGIRHALSEAPNVSAEDARFMLIICSAFANYLISLKIKD